MQTSQRSKAQSNQRIYGDRMFAPHLESESQLSNLNLNLNVIDLFLSISLAKFEMIDLIPQIVEKSLFFPRWFQSVFRYADHLVPGII